MSAPPPWLAERRNWLLWRLEPGGKKLRKVPYYVPATPDPAVEPARRHGRLDGPADLARLTTFDAAAAAAAVLPGGFRPGLAITDGLALIDLDGIGTREEIELGLCRHADVMQRVNGALLEISQSGTGVHILGTVTGTYTRASDGGGIEVYTRARFLAYTGDLLHVAGPQPSDLTQILAELAPPRGARDTSASLPVEPWTPADLLRATEKLLTLDPDCPRDPWLRIGMAIHAGTDGADEGRQLWDDWSNNTLVGGTAPSNYNAAHLASDWASFKPRGDGVGPGTLFAMPATRTAPTEALAALRQRQAAAEFDIVPAGADANVRPALSVNDFYLYAPKGGVYLFEPDGSMWAKAGVNKVLGAIAGPMGIVEAATFIDQTRPVHQITWAPGEPIVIEERLMDRGGDWTRKPGVKCFNLYRAPFHCPGNIAGRAVELWREHALRLYGSEGARLLELWFAHRSQRPHEKLNHALLMGGPQGIGKDTLIEPLRYSVGAANFAEETARSVQSRFNAAFLSSVVLRISEVHDTGDVTRQAFADAMKAYIAAPPETLSVQEKYIAQYRILNRTGVLYTTNHKLGSVWLTPDDRRHLVLWTDASKAEFRDGYWNDLWNAYAAGGLDDIAAYFRSVDLSGFDPKAPPPKTPAWHAIVAAHVSQDDSELSDALDVLLRPDVVTFEMIRLASAGTELATLFADRGRSRIAAAMLDEAGYEFLHNPTSKSNDKRWSVSLPGKPQVRLSLYLNKDLTHRERMAAARRFCEDYKR